MLKNKLFILNRYFDMSNSWIQIPASPPKTPEFLDIQGFRGFSYPLIEL